MLTDILIENYDDSPRILRVGEECKWMCIHSVNLHKFQLSKSLGDPKNKKNTIYIVLKNI